MISKRLLAPYPRLFHYLLLLLIGALALLPGTGTLPLIDRDEPRFAGATEEMVQRGEWIIPYFNGEYRFDKPVMIYWLMRAAFFLGGGPSEFGARIFSVLSALGVALVIYELGRHWFDQRVALWAAAGWLTCLQVLIHGRMAVADMPLILALALSHWALWELLVREQFSRRWFLLLYGSMAFGFLVKGPLALICPLLTCLLYRFVFWRKPLVWRRLNLAAGLPLLGVLIALWGVPALIETNGLFWDVGMGKHVAKRGVSSFNGRPFSVLYYFETSLFSLFPAIAFVGSAIAAVRRSWDERQAYLLSWVTGPYLIFSFYATQLPHYVLPAYPAACLLLGQTLHLPKDQGGRGGWFSIVMLTCGLLAGSAISAIALFETFPDSMAPLRILTLAMGCMLLSLAILGWLSACRRWPAMALPILGLAVSIGFGSQAFRDVSPAVQLVPLLRQMPSATRYYFRDYEEPSLIYYSGRHWDSLLLNKETRRLLSEPGAKMVVLLEGEQRLTDYLSTRLPTLIKPRKPQLQDTTRLRQWLAEAGYQSVQVQGLNSAHLSWVTIQAWHKQD